MNNGIIIINSQDLSKATTELPWCTSDRRQLNHRHEEHREYMICYRTLDVPTACRALCGRCRCCCGCLLGRVISASSNSVVCVQRHSIDLFKQQTDKINITWICCMDVDSDIHTHKMRGAEMCHATPNEHSSIQKLLQPWQARIIDYCKEVRK